MRCCPTGSQPSCLLHLCNLSLLSLLPSLPPTAPPSSRAVDPALRRPTEWASTRYVHVTLPARAGAMHSCDSTVSSVLDSLRADHAATAPVPALSIRLLTPVLPLSSPLPRSFRPVDPMCHSRAHVVPVTDGVAGTTRNIHSILHRWSLPLRAATHPAHPIAVVARPLLLLFRPLAASCRCRGISTLVSLTYFHSAPPTFSFLRCLLLRPTLAYFLLTSSVPTCPFNTFPRTCSVLFSRTSLQNSYTGPCAALLACSLLLLRSPLQPLH
jgi:hypothetical protein